MRKVLVRRMSARAGLAVLAGGLLGGVVTAVPAAAAGPSCAVSGGRVTCVYSAVGSDIFTVPEGVSQVTVDALGAQGGAASDGSAGGYGGEATAVIAVSGGQALQVNVGGQPAPGNPAAGGFNGGGAGGPSSFGGPGASGGGGGGASDVRQGGTGLDSRVVIAAGGGGSGGGNCTGGSGGGTSGGGTAPVDSCSSGGAGGTQTTGGVGGFGALMEAGGDGTSGVGGAGGTADGTIDEGSGGGGGGGGGLFGGGGGSAGVSINGGGGGGGSGLVPSGGTMTSGVRAGDGQVTISYTALPAQVTEAFGAPSVPFGGSTTLTFTVTNPNTDASLQLSGIGFTDTLPSPGLVVATPDNGLSGGCGGGTITAAPASSAITLSGATLGASQSCDFSVNVTGTRPGTYTNTTSPVTSGTGGTSTAATATVAVPGCPAATPNARLLTAATSAGTIIGGFCVNALGTGTYRQGPASGTGLAEDILGITTVTAHGTGLDLSGTGLGSLSTFHERAPVSATGTFTLG